MTHFLLILVFVNFGCSSIPQRLANAVADDVIDHSRPLGSLRQRLDAHEHRIGTLETKEHDDSEDIRTNRNNLNDSNREIDRRLRRLENIIRGSNTSASPSEKEKGIF